MLVNYYSLQPLIEEGNFSTWQSKYWLKFGFYLNNSIKINAFLKNCPGGSKVHVDLTHELLSLEFFRIVFLLDILVRVYFPVVLSESSSSRGCSMTWWTIRRGAWIPPGSIQSFYPELYYEVLWSKNICGWYDEFFHWTTTTFTLSIYRFRTWRVRMWTWTRPCPRRTLKSRIM